MDSIRLFIQHWALAISFTLWMGFRVVGWGDDIFAISAQVLLFLMAGHHIANACTSIIEIYRMGAKKGGFPDRRQG